MPLTLRAISLDDVPIASSITASFGAEGGSIGRADSNTLELPDPERRISRRQADVRAVGAGFIIMNVGSANPITVRERSLALGESAPLASGDRVRIGGYLLEVTIDSAIADDRTTIDPGGAGLDPFAPVRVNVAPPPAKPGFSPPAANRLPDDFDPFAPPAPAPSPPSSQSRPSAPTGGGGFEDLIPNAGAASIDSFFGLASSSSSADPLAAFLADMPTPRQPGDAHGDGSVSTDPLALFGSPKDVRPAATAESMPDQTPELRAAFVPPKPMPPIPGKLRPAAAVPSPAAPAPPAAPRPAPPVVPVATTTEDPTVPPAIGWPPEALAVWNALCEGAGVRLDPPPNTGPTFMRVIGMMLRASVEGTVQMMAMRQATRQELQAQVTVIRPRNNNPLKFAPDAQSALEQLLQPAVRGFLPGPAAMTDAMNDLLGHAIGTMAGTRAALEGVLKRFGPQELEAKLASKSMLDSVLPMNRKAKLWELYLQHYESIRDEAQEDFHTLFGRAFLAAYEQQLERLRREKAAAGR